MRGRAWCFTHNNYTEEDEKAYQAVDAKYLVYGRETGASGTPHLQGFLSFKNEKSPDQVRALLPGNPHIEKAKGNAKQASDYCKKDGDFFEKGAAPCQGKRTDLERMRDAIVDGERSEKVLRLNYTAALKYPSAMRQLIIDHRPKPSTPDILLRPWQEEAIQLLKLPAPDREIHFYVDLEGNAGKSTFANYVDSIFDHVQVIKPAKYADNAYELIEQTRILIMDVPRSRSELLQYNYLEDIKDGRVANTKYESYQKRLSACHVLVFMNEMPNCAQLSRDRIKIHTL